MSAYAFAAIVSVLALLIPYVHAGSVQVDDFADLSTWSVHPDGGLIEISRGDVTAWNGRPSVRLSFTCGKHYWGNAGHDITLPSSTCGVEFDLYVGSRKQNAAMFVWLFEQDGDGHVGWVMVDGKPLDKATPGWHHCFVPLSSFRYEPRGNKTPQLLTANKLLLGLGRGSADVSVANLAFRVAGGNDRRPESRTEGLKMVDGPKGRIAVFRDRVAPRPSHADPDVLGATLASNGYGVTFLKAGDMADPSVLTPSNFDCIVLPFGACYPYGAYESIRAYLKSGGSLVSVGGYALDQPCSLTADGQLAPVDVAATLTAEELTKSEPRRGLNTRYGKAADTLGLVPDQIGVFDPCYHLKEATVFRAAATQHIVPDSLKGKTRLQGYSACSMLGSNHPVAAQKWGRHVPLVQAYDSVGRLVGDVGSIAHNYAGPYAGSSWAFFGVTSTDLFASKGAFLPYLGGMVDSVVRKVYLHSLSTDLMCYRSGETVKLLCKVANYGKGDFRGSARFRIFDRSGRQVFASSPASVGPGNSAEVEAEYRPVKFASDLYRVVAELSADGRVMDELESGFLAYDTSATAGGPRVELEGNYLRIDGRPVLLSGTNVTGAMMYSGNENPLVWDRDLAEMHENGLNVMRIMHFSRALLDGGPGPFVPASIDIDKLPLKMERALDGLVQLCQRHRIVLFLSHTEFQPVLSTDELAIMRRFSKLIAQRYRNVPGLMIDIRNEPNPRSEGLAGIKQQPAILSDWNSFLRDKYRTDDQLKKAWKTSPPEASLGSVPCKPGTGAWDDMRTYDDDMFSNVLARRWIAANSAGLKEGGPDRLVTVGFLQEYWALNKIMCMDNLDFANMHSYTGMDVLRADMKLFDRRFEGKSLSLGEFGSVADHGKRGNGEDSETEDYARYLLSGHYLFGEGGSFLANWCWKDMDDVVFPWGIRYGCGGPAKDTLKAFRNQSLLFRQVRPVYTSPDVFLVIPTDQMLGGQSDGNIKMLYRIVDSLLDRRYQFGTIDDRHLHMLPETATVLIYPVPFSIPDGAYRQLESFVEAGGTLIITGDVSYDSLRRRTRTDRLERLCGVRFVSENYPTVNWTKQTGPCINVEALTARKTEDMDLYSNALGKGMVLYTPDPTGRMASDMTVFDRPDPLAQLGPVHMFRLDELEGSRTYVLVNPTDQPQTARFAEEGTSFNEFALGRAGIRLELAANGVGVIRVNGSGRLVAAEAQGPVTMAGKTLNMKGHFAVTALDGKDIFSSREMMVLPFGGGTLDLGGRGRLVVQTGEVKESGWHSLSESAGNKVTASGPTAFDVRIVAPRTRLAQLGRLVASEALLSPKPDISR